MGDWDTSTRNEPIPYMEFNVSRVVVHPRYNSINLQNNIAVMKLSSAVPLGLYPTISITCLPGTYYYLYYIEQKSALNILKSNSNTSANALLGIRYATYFLFLFFTFYITCRLGKERFLFWKQSTTTKGGGFTNC